jgi:hypothetical protein
MKYRPSPIAYPTTEEDEILWGFDILKPVGIPKAWIHDWSSAGVGFGKPLKEVADLIELLRSRVSNADLTEFSPDDTASLLSFFYKQDFHELYELMEEDVGLEKTLGILQKFGSSRGKRGWMATQMQWGTPVPLDKIAFFQDYAHYMHGPNMQPNTWFDDVKVVCSRTDCSLGPPTNMRKNAVLCAHMCGGMTDSYMEVDPTLLTAMLVDVGNEKWESRCVHIWTYESTVFNDISQEFIDNIPDSTKKILRERNVQIK